MNEKDRQLDKQIYKDVDRQINVKGRQVDNYIGR